MTKLIVTRHGETDYNVQKRFTGSTDIELNENGIRQAHELAEKLSNTPIDIIVSSSLRRAKQTANIISTTINKPVIIMDEFVERSVGVLEGLTDEERKNKYPELLTKATWRRKDSAPKNGESVLQVEERVLRALDTLQSNHKGKNILIVSHGGVARVMNGLLSEMSDEEYWTFKLDNCQTLEFDIKN